MMLYLGIDQHARQITISLRDQGGDVLQARQVSTQPEKVHAFFRQLTPNGIALSPDGKTLYVADNAARKDDPHTLVAYDVRPDGVCKRRCVLHDFKESRGI